ncbi:MAG: hypothetical protein QM682_04265 [Paracoccus sp. (in: a-proteobacteria)]|uniref:hypothetical protein n=1 Tax=Paracoccus sp. TaxID=267 RepID=UPI0039E50846
MKSIVMRTMAVAALLGAAGAPVAAMAQNADQPSPAAPLAAGQVAPPPLPQGGPGQGGPGQGGPEFARSAPGGAVPMDAARMEMVPALGLAAHLAATETYLGITEAQEDVWRDYCQALIAFLEPGAPVGPGDQAPGDAPPADQARPLAAERMAQQVLARAGQAQGLLAAATALRGALEPVQLERLRQVDPGFGPERGAPRHQGPDPAQRHRPGPRPQPIPAPIPAPMPAPGQ